MTAFKVMVLWVVVEVMAGQSLAEAGISLDISYDTSKAAMKIDVEMPATYIYFGLVFGSGMFNTDMILFYKDGAITDRWSTTEDSMPPADAQQDIISPSSALTSDGKNRTFTMWRKMDTGDTSQDTVINCGQKHNWEWAARSSFSAYTEMHNYDGDVQVTFNDDCTVKSGSKALKIAVSALVSLIAVTILG